MSVKKSENTVLYSSINIQYFSKDNKLLQSPFAVCREIFVAVLFSPVSPSLSACEFKNFNSQFYFSFNTTVSEQIEDGAKQ